MQPGDKFDIIIVGAGYAGLTAARDATASGLKILVLEGRDRIGGRTFSSQINGHYYDMGGTWFSWDQPHIWREICRYNLTAELAIPPEPKDEKPTFVLQNKDGKKTMGHDEERRLYESSLKLFVNVDGNLARDIIPFPYDENINPQSKRYDAMSIQDRINEISHALTPDEKTTLSGFMTLCCGAPLDKSSFYEFLHWWALCSYSYDGCVKNLETYKLRRGQSALARALFDEACGTGNLAYAFDSSVVEIEDNASGVSVKIRGGETFHGRTGVVAMPLNMLSTVEFTAGLPREKQSIIREGHRNRGLKVHLMADGDRHRAWNAIDYPAEPLNYLEADGITPEGNTHIVGFGVSKEHALKVSDVEGLVHDFEDLSGTNVLSMTFHEWATDDFSRGSWYFPRPNMATHPEELRKSVGNLQFASADWATGWRGYIDGAIQEGTRAAKLAVEQVKGNATTVFSRRKML